MPALKIGWHFLGCIHSSISEKCMYSPKSCEFFITIFQDNFLHKYVFKIKSNFHWGRSTDCPTSSNFYGPKLKMKLPHTQSEPLVAFLRTEQIFNRYV